MLKPIQELKAQHREKTWSKQMVWHSVLFIAQLIARAIPGGRPSGHSG